MRILLLAAVAALSTLVSAANAATCDETRDTLRRELAIRPSGPDDPETYARHDRLRTLFLLASPACAKELHEQLAETASDDELSQAFHYALATPTRAALRTLLRKNFEPYDAVDAAIEESVGGAAERDTLHCWVERLRVRDADTRIIRWQAICPTDAASCPARVRPSDADLAALASADDVESTANEVGLFYFVRNAVEIDLLDSNSTEVVDKLEAARSQLADTRRAVGAADAPAHYGAIADWLAQKDDDPNSIVSCPRLFPSQP